MSGGSPARGRVRTVWIDQARGLGIVLVVIGHVLTGAAVHHWIFLFHMPLFFVLSGMVAKPISAGDYLRSRGRSLLVPYAAYLLLVGGLDLILSAVDGRFVEWSAGSPLRVAARLAIGGTELGGVFGVFWFVPCLFAAGLAFGVVARRGAATVAVAGMLGVLLAYLLPFHRSPLGLLAVPMALFFICVGWLVRERMVNPQIGVTTGAVMLIATGLFAGPFDMKYLWFGTPWTAIPAALGGSLLVMSVARILGRVGWIGRALGWLGTESLVIMFLHQLIHFHLQGRQPQWGIVVLAIALSLGCAWSFGKWRVSARLLLGRGMAVPITV